VIRYTHDGHLDDTFGGDWLVLTPIFDSYDIGYAVTVTADGKRRHLPTSCGTRPVVDRRTGHRRRAAGVRSGLRELQGLLTLPMLMTIPLPPRGCGKWNGHCWQPATTWQDGVEEKVGG
jgi:hypothetical protein